MKIKRLMSGILKLSRIDDQRGSTRRFGLATTTRILSTSAKKFLQLYSWKCHQELALSGDFDIRYIDSLQKSGKRTFWKLFFGPDKLWDRHMESPRLA